MSGFRNYDVNSRPDSVGWTYLRQGQGDVTKGGVGVTTQIQNGLDPSAGPSEAGWPGIPRDGL